MPFSDGAFSKFAFSSDPASAPAPPSGNVNIAGVQGTTFVGSIFPSIIPTRTFPGVQANTSTGLLLTQVGPDFHPATMLGVQATMHVGNLHTGGSKFVAGNQATTSVGILQAIGSQHGFQMGNVSATSLPISAEDLSVNIRLSQDGGLSWRIPPRINTLGVEGQYSKVVNLNQLGMARNLVIEISTASQRQVSLNGVFVQFKVTGS